jgi:hypothetical protein
MSKILKDEVEKLSGEGVLFHFQINAEIIRPLGGRGTRPADTRMIVHTPLGEAGASPSGRTNRPDGAQEMAVWIEKWNQT